HISRIDLNLFTVFEAINSEGSVTRASQKLNRTQPAISHALGRLRQQFGDPLFVRQGHAMVSTPLARSIIEPVRQSLRGFEGTLDGAIDVLLPLSPEVRHTRILVDKTVVVARKGHPALGNSIDLDTYLGQEHILVSSRRKGPGLEDVELSRLGLRRRIRLRCQ